MAVREEESITSFGKNPQKSDVYDEDERTVGATSGESGRVYGKLVLLGYSGALESGSYVPGTSYVPGSKHHSKMLLRKRVLGNGIKRKRITTVNMSPLMCEPVCNRTRHVISYWYQPNFAILVEYEPDPSKDMFQIGRCSEDEIDFTVVDTWLTTSSDPVLSPVGEHRIDCLEGLSKAMARQAQVGSLPTHSTISRYACRIQIDRDEPHRAFLYASAFDGCRNIMFSEKTMKWLKPDGGSDGVTTNGVLLLHPKHLDREDVSGDVEDYKRMFVWREISVDGDIYKLRETRASTRRGDLVVGETNELQDGSLIDLCGATLLWRTAEGLAKSPSRNELELRLDELNAGKPQCPVNLNTLVIPRKKPAGESSSSRQPYAYLNCGHVQGKHGWGKSDVSNVGTSYKCPICLLDSTKIIQLVMGMESAFHLDSDTLDYAFNPCGHVASFSTVRYWSRIPLPHGTTGFYPVCPFCTTLLSKEKPYVRLIFQDHCFGF